MANATLAFENLTGIRNRAKVRGAEQRREHHAWAFYQLKQLTRYKANIAGVPVVNIDPRYTRQTCSQCGHIHPEPGKSYRNGKTFKCGHCGFEHDADGNAAMNISKLGATLVNWPEVPGMSCLLDRTDLGQSPVLYRAG
ncbi:MAG: transposase [Leptolyngbyaceae cyanobacterium bins.59]|nr:transposase [Leptolyngbyaceae cyanobacterium bins.59]